MCEMMAMCSLDVPLDPLKHLGYISTVTPTICGRAWKARKRKERQCNWYLLFAFSAFVAPSLGSSSWFFSFFANPPPTLSPWSLGEAYLPVPGMEDVTQAWPIKVLQSSSLDDWVRERHVTQSNPIRVNLRTSAGAPPSWWKDLQKIVGLVGDALAIMLPAERQSKAEPRDKRS